MGSRILPIVFSFMVLAPLSAFGEPLQSRASVAVDPPIVHEYIEDETIVREDPVAELPPNIAIVGFDKAVRAMLRWSPTFRRQCARLAAADRLSITVASTLPPGAPHPAQTRLAFMSDGRMQAHVDIGSEGDSLELVAHEFEHILEHLDGVDLPSMARRSATGVHAVQAGGPYETTRASAAGRQVAREVREHQYGGQ